MHRYVFTARPHTKWPVDIAKADEHQFCVRTSNSTCYKGVHRNIVGSVSTMLVALVNPSVLQ